MLDQAADVFVNDTMVVPVKIGGGDQVGDLVERFIFKQQAA